MLSIHGFVGPSPKRYPEPPSSRKLSPRRPRTPRRGSIRTAAILLRSSGSTRRTIRADWWSSSTIWLSTASRGGFSFRTSLQPGNRSFTVARRYRCPSERHCGVGRTDSPSCHRRRNSSTGVRSSTSMVRRSVRVLSMRNGTEGRHCVESGSTSTVTQQITCCARYRRTIGPVSTTACSVRLPWHCAPGADHSGCWSRSKVTDETKTCCPVPTCPGPSAGSRRCTRFGSISPDSEWTRRRS